MNESTDSAVTLEAFAERVGCHFTTASRLRAGHRLPGRKLLGRIIREYGLDPNTALGVYTTGTVRDFGQYLNSTVFNPHVKEAVSDQRSRQTA